MTPLSTIADPVDTGRKLKVLCRFSFRLVLTGESVHPDSISLLYVHKTFV